MGLVWDALTIYTDGVLWCPWTGWWWFQDSGSPEGSRAGASCRLDKAEGRWQAGPSLACVILSGSTGKRISVQSGEFLLQAGREAAS